MRNGCGNGIVGKHDWRLLWTPSQRGESSTAGFFRSRVRKKKILFSGGGGEGGTVNAKGVYHRGHPYSKATLTVLYALIETYTKLYLALNFFYSDEFFFFLRKYFDVEIFFLKIKALFLITTQLPFQHHTDFSKLLMLLFGYFVLYKQLFNIYKIQMQRNRTHKKTLASPSKSKRGFGRKFSH